MSLVLNRPTFVGTLAASYNNADDADFDNVAGTAPIYVAGPATGLIGVRFPAATQSIIKAAVAGSPTTLLMSYLFKLSGPTTATSVVLQARTTADAIGPHVAFTSANRLQLLRTSGTSTTGAQALPTGVWFRVTFSSTGTAITVTIFANDTTTTPLETLSLTNTATTTFTNVRSGWLTAGGGGSGVTLDMAWPEHESTTTDPGPRTYPVAVSVAPPAGGLVLGSTAPGVTAGNAAAVGVAPPGGSLVLSSTAPGVVAGVVGPVGVAPPAGVLTLSSTAPGVTAGNAAQVAVAPPGGLLTLSATPPGVVAVSAVATPVGVVPLPGVLVLDATPPALAVGGSSPVGVTPTAGVILLGGTPPVIVAGTVTRAAITALPGALVLTGLAVTVLAPSAIAAEIDAPAGRIVMGAARPTVTATIDVSDFAVVGPFGLPFEVDGPFGSPFQIRGPVGD